MQRTSRQGKVLSDMVFSGVGGGSPYFQHVQELRVQLCAPFAGSSLGRFVDLKGSGSWMQASADLKGVLVFGFGDSQFFFGSS